MSLLTTIFCDVDDFCKCLEPLVQPIRVWRTNTRGPMSREDLEAVAEAMHVL